ncbi:S8 family serine peptidase [Falsiroseomonas sp. HC035]|uniref:S8 family serine peptidase n=1 Tax=Falsiroseomonas sp. HC035 TaxID=3390999 RepID=UPI003D31A472
MIESVRLWHLGDSAGGIRAVTAWGSATGHGVRVAVVDDGFELGHPDLAGRIDLVNSFDFVDRDTTPAAARNQAHGTAVLGLVGAAADGQGVVGAAPGATLVGIRTVFGQGAASLAEAVATAATRAEIVTNSWGFYGAFADAPYEPGRQALLEALSAAAAGGRGGLGTLIVSAAGNTDRTQAGNVTGHSAISGLHEVIVVAASNMAGKAATQSTPGAGLLVAAPGERVLTTDLLGTAGFGVGSEAVVSGTSFAAPLVSGIAALMLEVEPRLGVRDVQAILAATARPAADAVTNGATDWNAGGARFSTTLGYGIVDAAAAVRLAETWLASGSGPATFANEAALTATAPGRFVLPEAVQAAGRPLALALTGDLRVEAVSLSLTLDPAAALATRLALVSPSGARSELLGTGIRPQAAAATPMPERWTITSQAFRGEAAAGTWTLLALDTSLDGIEAGIADIVLTAYGTQAPRDDRWIFTDALASGGTLGDYDGGRDVLNAAAMTGALVLDLAASAQRLGAAAITLATPGAIENAIGSAGHDQIAGTDAANMLAGGGGNDTLLGQAGNDTLWGGTGDDLLIGGSDEDVAGFATPRAEMTFGGSASLMVVEGPQGRDTLEGIEWIELVDGSRLATAAVAAQGGFADTAALQRGGVPMLVLMRDYVGPVTWVQRELIGSDQGEAVVASPHADFLNLLGGDDAAVGGAGDDVLDGGLGSNFLSGGAGRDVFFVDGRGGGQTWSTISDFCIGSEQLSVWGWRPGVSRSSWEAWSGAPGWEGATLRLDLDGDGQVECSVTWTGLQTDSLPRPVTVDGLLWFV